MPDDLYAVLGVPKGADEAEIKKTYRKLAKTLHPDKNPGDSKAEARFKQVNHAFDVLSDARKRKLYDEFGEDGLREGFDAEKVRAYKQWSSSQGGGGGRRGGGAGGARLEDLFGNATGGGGQGGDFSEILGDIFSRGRRSRGPTPGPDLSATVTIDFASAVRGTMVELHTKGDSAEPLKVRIPQGADDGSRVRIAGQGAPSHDGGPRGDLLLDIHVEPHKFFRREEDDLHLDLPITLLEAIRGGKVKVPTIDGSVSLKVMPGTQTGATARLRGKGVTRKSHTGDLYVHYQVRVPTTTTPELEKLLDALEKLPAEDVRADLAL